MELVKIDKVWDIICWKEDTNYGFRHIGVIMKNGQEVFRTKVCYRNRADEQYEFQTILIHTIIKYTDKLDKEYKKQKKWEEIKREYRPLVDFLEKV